MTYQTPKNFGLELCSILHLDATKIRCIQITVEPNDVVLVTTQSFLEWEEAEALKTLLHQFQLIPKINENEDHKKS